MVREHALVLALESGGCSKHEIMLTTSPFYHTGGLMCILKMAALAGTVVLVERFDAPAVLDMIERYEVTQLLMVPPVVYRRLTSCPKRADLTLPSVRDVLISGGRCDLGYARSIFELFPNARLRFSWGSTEACSITSIALDKTTLERRPELVSTVGTVNALVEVKLVDERGQDVKDGEVGEGLVRSPMVFQGYLGNVKESGQDVLAGGWLRTGDLLKRDAEGYYYLVDRLKDVIKTGGENVYALEIERVLLEHPYIADCAVVGVYDEVYEEGIAAAIVLEPGRTLDPDDLISFCRSHLPGYKKPRYWAVLDALPVNSIGKVQKAELRRRGRALFSPLPGINRKG